MLGTIDERWLLFGGEVAKGSGSVPGEAQRHIAGRLIADGMRVEGELRRRKQDKKQSRREDASPSSILYLRDDGGLGGWWG